MKKKTKIIAAVAIVVAALALGALWAWKYAVSPYEGARAVRVNIPAGATVETVDSILCSDLGPDFGARVAWLWRRQGGDAARAHGSYVVSPGDKAIGVSRIISAGRQTPLRFTFNNLRTFGQLAARVDAVLETDSATFAATADSILSTKGFAPTEYAAAFMPDTYEFYWTADPHTIVNKLLDARTTFWTSDRLAKAEQLGITPVQAATLASIVEEESNKAEERPTIARLYLNRLNRGMPLQADPTVKFAVGDFALRRITGRHLAVESPYNTYKNTGLPPGPIRIADGAAIDAVLNAPQHKYLYMCAKSDFSGYHNFAETYDRHRINSALYHRALNRRGIGK